MLPGATRLRETLDIVTCKEGNLHPRFLQWVSHPPPRRRGNAAAATWLLVAHAHAPHLKHLNQKTVIIIYVEALHRTRSAVLASLVQQAAAAPS